MSPPHTVIGIIEDDPQIRRFLRTALDAHGFSTFEAETGKQGLTMAATHKPDLIILDLGLPDMDGVEVVARLREWMTRPVIILSARDQERDKVTALDAGADDYLTKPFGVEELLARIRVALRHASRSGEQDALFVSGPIKVDLTRRQVFRNGEEVHLTPIEYRLLALLIRDAGKVLTQRHLLTEVWGPSYVENSHYLRIYMGALRQKLERDPARPELLITEAGVGYRLKAE
jgi:two-component system, OmpR family, KDP operon response regulator KdpE